MVAFNYRLHPKVNAPEYIEDFVAAVARVFKNKDQYGGDTSHIYVCRFSSGGYLSLMVTLDHYAPVYYVRDDAPPFTIDYGRS